MKRVCTGVLLSLLSLLSAGSVVHAQETVLRVTGAADASVPAVRVDGAPAYPAGTLELLGFTLQEQADVLIAASGADTLRFWTTSPFFRAGDATHQLAFSVRRHEGVLHLPEQFFISWLPAWRAERYAFAGGALRVAAGVAGAVGAAPAAATPRAVRPAAQPAAAATRQRVVVIDPGHGGVDPGKVANGVREKDLTLRLSRQLGAVLEARGYEVHLTRTTDTLIALQDRPQLANSWRGDRPVAVFLSIHANAFQSQSVRGFETFFLSEARTEDERRVAAMENEAVRFEAETPLASDDGLGQILNNLRSDFLMRASHDLASSVQDRLAAFHPGPNRGVKRGELIVLIGSIMPAVLIEAGFLTNPAEAGLLATDAFQRKVVTGIADAVDDFFSRNEHLWVHAP